MNAHDPFDHIAELEAEVKRLRSALEAAHEIARTARENFQRGELVNGRTPMRKIEERTVDELTRAERFEALQQPIERPPAEVCPGCQREDKIARLHSGRRVCNHCLVRWTVAETAPGATSPHPLPRAGASPGAPLAVGSCE